MRLIFLSLLFIIFFSSPAWAIPNQGNIILSHEGVDHIGLFTFDPKTIESSPFGLPEETHGTTLTSFNLFFFNHQWDINPPNFSRLSASISPDPSAPIQTTINYDSREPGVGLLVIFGGHTDFPGEPFHGGSWHYENVETGVFTGGRIRTQLTPEPSTWILLTSGLLGIAAWRWKKRKTVKET